MIVQGIPSPGDGLRLHLNENTGGCSPRVLEAIRALTAEDISAYPDYRAPVIACAKYFGIDPDWLLLTNGLDEGILVAALACFARAHDAALEAIVPVPAFDPYLSSTAIVNARVVRVPPGPDYAFPLRQVLAAITPKTRLIFLNTPSNPTGQTISRDALRQVITSAPQATVVIDEAYVEFSEGGSFLDELPRYKNAVLGRTFSKAFGLAGMRIGCLIGHPDTMKPIRTATPVFNMNIVAIAALQAAIQDTEFLPRYAEQVKESRTQLYDACQRLGLQYWPSEANFVLVRVGDRATEVMQMLAAKGVHVRDRSKDSNSPGCIRITAGIVEHTHAGIQALEAAVASGVAQRTK